jgi:hypothetical protein
MGDRHQVTIEAPVDRRERSTAHLEIPPEEPAARQPSPVWLVDHIKQRKWALLAIVVFVAVSLAFSFLWGPVVRHQSIWVIPGDIWFTFRNAHLVGWGDIGGIYNPAYGLLTFPAVVVALAPVAMVSGHFGLTESFGSFTVIHPSAWFWLGPAMLLFGASCLVAFDAMAEELGIGRGKRIFLLGVEAAIVFQVVTLWGHPEDMVSMGLATYALLMGSRGRWTSAGWLWGAAIAFQPLVLILIPLAFATAPRGHRLRLCIQSALPSAALLAAPLATQWAMTTKSLLHQGSRTDLGHPTPWMVLSSPLGPHMVTAGSGRLIALSAAVVIGWIAWRLRPSLATMLWMGAVALSLRCFFESVMYPFYVGAPLALILIACAVRPGWYRLTVASVVAIVAMVLSFHHLGEWAYWLPLMALLAVGLACGWPGRTAFGSRSGSGPVAVEVGDGQDLVPV